MIINLTGVIDDGSMQSSAVPTNPRTQINLSIGVDATINVQVLNPSGSQASLAGAVLLLTVKKKPIEDVKIQKTGVIAGGLVVFTITPADTKNLQAGSYVYDVWMTQGGVRNPVVPLSPLQLLASVTPPP